MLPFPISFYQSDSRTNFLSYIFQEIIFITLNSTLVFCRWGGKSLSFILFSSCKTKNDFILHQCAFQLSTTDFLCWFNFCLCSVYLALWHGIFSRTDSPGNYSFWSWWHILQMLYLLITLSRKFKNNNKPPTHTSINVFFINFFLLKLSWFFFCILCWECVKNGTYKDSKNLICKWNDLLLDRFYFFSFFFICFILGHSITPQKRKENVLL